MAMIPFCGYNMGDYFGHWLSMGKKLSRPPKIFSANWFRVDDNGEFIWPGFGENIRVLKWIVDRAHGRVQAQETPVGLIPQLKDLNLEGLSIPKDNLARLFDVDMSKWTGEVEEINKFLSQFGGHLPKEISDEYNTLAKSVRG